MSMKKGAAFAAPFELALFLVNDQNTWLMPSDTPCGSCPGENAMNVALPQLDRVFSFFTFAYWPRKNVRFEKLYCQPATCALQSSCNVPGAKPPLSCEY